MFNIADSLSKKIYGWNALGTNFQKTHEEARSCINYSRATQAKYFGLQNNINSLCKSLNEIDDKILAVLERENTEFYVSESMSIMESLDEISAEITLKLENMKFRDSEQSFERGDNKIFNAKLPKLEFPILKVIPRVVVQRMANYLFHF